MTTYLDDEGNPTTTYLDDEGNPVGPKPRTLMDDMGSIFTGARKGLGIPDKLTDILTGPAYAVAHPIDSAQLFGGSIMDAARGRTAQTASAVEAAKGGNLSPMLIDALSNIIGPAGGPSGPEVVRGMVEGGPEGQRPEAFGQALGTVLGSLPLKKLVGQAMPPKAPRIGPPTLAESLPDVPLLKSQATGSKARGIIEKALGSSLPGSKAFGEARAAQQAALIDGQAESLVQAISKTKGSAEEIGSMAQSAIEEAKANVLENVINPKYADIDAAAKGARVSTGPIKVFANKVRDEIKAITGGGRGKVGGLLPPEEFSRMNNILDTIRRGPKEVDFSTMQRFRSEMLARVRALGDETGRAKGIVKEFSRLADESMQNAVGSGHPDLINMVRDANSTYAQFIQDFDKSVISKMAKAAPEKVPAMLRTATLEDIRAFRRNVPAGVYKDVKAHVLRDVIESSIDQKGANPPPSVGPLQFPGAVEPNLSMNPTKLRTALKKMGDAKLAEIYTPQELEGINKVLQTAERIGGSANSIGGSFIINGILASSIIKGGTEMMSGGGLGSLTQAAGIYGSTKLLAKIMARPAGASALTRIMNVVNRNNSHLPLAQRFSVPPTNLRGLTFPVMQLNRLVQEEAEKEAMKDEGTVAP